MTAPELVLVTMEDCPHCARFMRSWLACVGDPISGVKYTRLDIESKRAQHLKVPGAPFLLFVHPGKKKPYVYKGPRRKRALHEWVLSFSD